MKEETHDKIKKVQLFAAVSLLALSFLFLFDDSGITGHFSVEFISQTLDLEIDQSQKFLMSANSDEPIHIFSFRVSGEVIGEGSVEIFIEDNTGQKVRVYKNVKRKEQGMPVITGMMVGIGESIEYAEKPAETLIMLKYLGNVEWDSQGFKLSSKEELISGSFNNQCVDSCFIEMPLSNKNNYELIFNIEPGTKFKLNNIIYNLKDEKT